jgi:hypothetical protein
MLDNIINILINAILYNYDTFSYFFSYEIYIVFFLIMFVLWILTIAKKYKYNQKLNYVINSQKDNSGIVVNNKNKKNFNKRNINLIKKNVISKKIVQKNNDALELLKNAPNNISIIDYKLTELPPNVIEFISQNNYKLNNNKIDALSAFLISKGLYIKFFRNDTNTLDLIKNFVDFKKIYKKYTDLEKENSIGYNFCLKFFNIYDSSYSEQIFDSEIDHDYFFLTHDTIIKINKKDSFGYIEKRLEKNNIFLIQQNDKIIISYGSYVIVDISPELIDYFFSKSIEESKIKKYYKYNKVKILYWVSTFV